MFNPFMQTEYLKIYDYQLLQGQKPHMSGQTSARKSNKTGWVPLTHRLTPLMITIGTKQM